MKRATRSSGFWNVFYNCKALENIEFGGDGRISQDINFQDCPLTPESMVSIITHLKSFVMDGANRYTRTITFSNECWARLEAAIPNTSPQGTWRGEVEYEYGWNT